MDETSGPLFHDFNGNAHYLFPSDFVNTGALPKLVLYMLVHVCLIEASWRHVSFSACNILFERR